MSELSGLKSAQTSNRGYLRSFFIDIVQCPLLLLVLGYRFSRGEANPGCNWLGYQIPPCTLKNIEGGFLASSLLRLS